MKKLIFILSIIFVSCKKEVIPSPLNAAITPADTCAGGFSGDSLYFGYTLTEVNSGLNVSQNRTVALTTASRCFNEGKFLITDGPGMEFWFTFQSNPAFVSSYNKNDIHILKSDGMGSFISQPHFPSAVIYRVNWNQVTNAKMKVNCLEYVKTDECLTNHSLYYAEFLITWDMPGKSYSLLLRTSIMVIA